MKSRETSNAFCRSIKIIFFYRSTSCHSLLLNSSLEPTIICFCLVLMKILVSATRCQRKTTFTQTIMNRLGKPQKTVFFSGPASKALSPPPSNLVAGPLKIPFFAASLTEIKAANSKMFHVVSKNVHTC